MTLKLKLQILSWIVFPLGIAILFQVDWKVAAGVILFGWGMNLENKAKTLKH